MANGSADKSQLTVIQDKYGNVILEIGITKYMVREPDGSIKYYQKSYNIQLVDGLQWNPGMLLANPPIYVGICDSCRDICSLKMFKKVMPTHGIVSLGRAKLCECGTLCCPSHRKLCSDGKWRCLTCARKHMVKELLRPIFFTRTME